MIRMKITDENKKELKFIIEFHSLETYGMEDIEEACFMYTARLKSRRSVRYSCKEERIIFKTI